MRKIRHKLFFHFDRTNMTMPVRLMNNNFVHKLVNHGCGQLGKIGVNYDQFCAEHSKINEWFNFYWENQLYHSGLTKNDIELSKERRKLDRECSVEQEVDMLRKCKFDSVECVYSYQKFSVIIAVK